MRRKPHPADAIGAPVYDVSGERLGTVDQVYYDDRTRAPKWLAIRDGLVSGRRVLVPIEATEPEPAGVRVLFPYDTVIDAPEVTTQHLSRGEEVRIYAHYGITVPARPEDETLVLHEEQADVSRTFEPLGLVRARKVVETDPYEETTDVRIEDADISRVPAEEGDSGKVEALPDGSISIPLFEEEIVVTKRAVVRERIVIQRRVVTEPRRIETELRRERLEIDADPGVDVVDEREGAEEPD
jgi:uncharacterized protein (TIGR02271 family)